MRVGPAREPETVQGQVPENEHRGAESERAPRHPAVGHHVRARAERVREGGGGVAADAVEAEMEGAAVRPLVEEGGEGFGGEGVFGDDFGGAEGLEGGCELGGFGGGPLADDGDVVEAPELGELDRGAADAAVGAVLDEPVPRLEGDEVLQQAPGRDRVDGGGGDLRGGQAGFIDAHDGGFVDLQVRAPCAEPARARNHPVADGHVLDG